MTTDSSPSLRALIPVGGCVSDQFIATRYIFIYPVVIPRTLRPSVPMEDAYPIDDSSSGVTRHGTESPRNIVC